MPISYTYDSNRNLILTEAKGSIQAEEILEYFEKVGKTNNLRPGFVEVVDMTSAIVVYTSFSSNKKVLKKAREELSNNGCLGTVLYSPGKLMFSIALAMKRVMDKGGYSILVVTDEEEIEAAIHQLYQRY